MKSRWQFQLSSVLAGLVTCSAIVPYSVADEEALSTAGRTRRILHELEGQPAGTIKGKYLETLRENALVAERLLYSSETFEQMAVSDRLEFLALFLELPSDFWEPKASRAEGLSPPARPSHQLITGALRMADPSVEAKRKLLRLDLRDEEDRHILAFVIRRAATRWKGRADDVGRARPRFLGSRYVEKEFPQLGIPEKKVSGLGSEVRTLEIFDPEFHVRLEEAFERDGFEQAMRQILWTGARFLDFDLDDMWELMPVASELAGEIFSTHTLNTEAEKGVVIQRSIGNEGGRQFELLYGDDEEPEVVIFRVPEHPSDKVLPSHSPSQWLKTKAGTPLWLYSESASEMDGKEWVLVRRVQEGVFVPERIEEVEHQSGKSYMRRVAALDGLEARQAHR